jgi:hypothetical protein
MTHTPSTTFDDHTGGEAGIGIRLHRPGVSQKGTN